MPGYQAKKAFLSSSCVCSVDPDHPQGSSHAVTLLKTHSRLLSRMLCLNIPTAQRRVWLRSESPALHPPPPARPFHSPDPARAQGPAAPPHSQKETRLLGKALHPGQDCNGREHGGGGGEGEEAKGEAGAGGGAGRPGCCREEVETQPNGQTSQSSRWFSASVRFRVELSDHSYG